MIFRNLETGVEWEVTNPDRIVELEKSNLYESVVATPKKETVKPVEKETEKPMEEKPKAKKKEAK